MKRPWMPLYVGDYLADTAHLTVAESGAYLHLIMHYWVNGGLPTDEAVIARITRMTSRQWSRSRDVLRSLFDDHWRHHRIDHELSQAIEISEKRSAIAVQMHSKRNANAHTLTLTHTNKKNVVDFRKEEKQEGCPASPSSAEFQAWKEWAFKNKIALWRELIGREQSGRTFDFETRWPPDYRSAQA